jgi:hypothetical protein
LQALKALRRAHALDPANPKLLEPLVSFFAPNHLSTLSELDRTVVDGQRSVLCPQDSLDALVSQSLQTNGNSARHILGAAKATEVLHPGSAEAETLVFQLTRDEIEVDLEVSVTTRIVISFPSG